VDGGRGGVVVQNLASVESAGKQFRPEVGCPSFEPKKTKVQLDLGKGFCMHIGCLGVYSQHHPSSGFESEDLQSFEDWIDEPGMQYPMLCVHGHLLRSVDLSGGRGEDLTGPIRGNRDPIMRFFNREPCLLPAGQIGDQDVFSEFCLRFKDDYPSPWAAATAEIVGGTHLIPQS
jgi:hypothetical protein